VQYAAQAGQSVHVLVVRSTVLYMGDGQPELMHPDAQWPGKPGLLKRDNPKQRPTFCRSRQVHTRLQAVLPIASQNARAFV
jgi:hypothetical protein